MSSSHSHRETAAFELIVPQLEAHGFEVFLHPPAKMLPAFLKSYLPDAVALKNDRKIAIEISSSAANREPKLQQLQALFSNHTDWELRVIYAPPRNGDPASLLPDRKLIEEQLDRTTTALSMVGPAASLLIAWATFEASARSLLPEDLERPQTPANLIEVLASEGYVTPDEAAFLRNLGKRRNDAAHGRLDVELAPETLDQLVGITRAILAMHDQQVMAVR